MNQFNPRANSCIQSGFNLKRFLIIISLVFIFSYGIFSARSIILGPSIEIFNPVAAEIETKENVITIKGRVKNAIFLSLNERSISIDTEGYFEEKLLLAPSFNIIEIRAKDRFKNEAKRVVRVYFNQSIASSTTSNSSSTEEILLEN